MNFYSVRCDTVNRVSECVIPLQIVKECNEGVRKMSRTEELISIEKTLEFKSKVIHRLVFVNHTMLNGKLVWLVSVLGKYFICYNTQLLAQKSN